MLRVFSGLEITRKSREITQKCVTSNPLMAVMHCGQASTSLGSDKLLTLLGSSMSKNNASALVMTS
jgi:hypothetical protein